MLTREMEAATLRDAANIIKHYHAMSRTLGNLDMANRLSSVIDQLEALAVQIEITD